MWLKNWWKWCPSVKCLGPGGTPRHYASHPDPSCLHMTLLYIVLGSLWVKKDELNMILLNCLMVNIAHNLTHLYPVSYKRDIGKQRRHWSEGFWTGPLISVCVVCWSHAPWTYMYVNFLPGSPLWTYMYCPFSCHSANEFSAILFLLLARSSPYLHR